MQTLVLSFGLLAGIQLPTSSAPQSDLALFDHAGLNSAISELKSTFSEVVKVVPVGHSRMKKRIDAVRISGQEFEGKPALLLVAGLEGPDVFDSSVAMAHARQLAAGYGNDEAITAFLDATTVLIIPRANPDAAEARFTSPRLENEFGGRGVDNDRDGRSGEDPAADVDGDGAILTMRVLDSEGTWILDPTDERAMVEADANKGEIGLYRLLTEGRDLDGDELVAEDGAHDTRLNRTFPSGWEEHADDSGLFPSDEPETRALMEFVMKCTEISLVLCYGAPENLVEAPKSVKDDAKSVMRIPPAGILQSDADVLAELSKRYESTTSNEATRKSGDEGSFQRWCYDHRGLMTLSAVLWEMPEDWKEPENEAETEETDNEDATNDAASEEPVEEPEVEPETESETDSSTEKPKDEPKPSTDAKRLKWIDGSEEAWRFVDWKSFDHPELGAVDIGGFAPFALREPPQPEWDSIATREFEYLIELGALLPRLAITECEAIDLGGDLWRIETTVSNSALLPLQSRSARRTRTIPPAKLNLVLGADAELLGGQARKLISELAGSGGREETVWLVRTKHPDRLQVTIESVNAGGASVRPEVK
ncbi:MAG: hypothetical protein ACI8TQ_002505 [Planctomycetota bacterium]|jgi:hypothetical protein